MINAASQLNSDWIALAQSSWMRIKFGMCQSFKTYSALNTVAERAIVCWLWARANGVVATNTITELNWAYVNTALVLLFAPVVDVPPPWSPSGLLSAFGINVTTYRSVHFKSNSTTFVYLVTVIPCMTNCFQVCLVQEFQSAYFINR